jgi:lysylphosphatidylglycerol synthase-like protein
MGGEGAGAVQQAFGGMAAALAGVAPGWLCLGLALHLCNQLLRGRGWWAIVRAAHDGRIRVRRRDAIAAWIAGAGAAGVFAAQVGDALRVWLLSRRVPDAGYALLAGTLVAEAAGGFLAGLPLAVVAVMIGVGPRLPATWPAAAGAVAILAVVVAAAVVTRRRARDWPVLAQLREGCAPLTAPRAYAASVTPWQLASRACGLAAVACFLGAFHLPVTPRTVLVVIFAQASGRVLSFAPAALGAGVVVLAATFGAAAHGTVGTGRVAAFLVGTTTLLTLLGAVMAAAVVVRSADWSTLARAARRTPAAEAPAG